jgi:hypothetical protein
MTEPIDGHDEADAPSDMTSPINGREESAALSDMTPPINGREEAAAPSNMTSMALMAPPMPPTSPMASQAPGESQKGIRRMVFFLLICALLGILLGQLLGTFLVAGSNRQLWLEQEAIARLGYIAVPGQFLASEMKAMSTYLAGGIFFALSIGLGYGFFCGFLVWIFSLYKRKGYWQVRLLPVIAIAAFLTWQGKGSDPAVLLFLLIVPLVLYFLSFPLLSRASIRQAQLGSYGFLFLIFAILLVVTFKQLDFIQIRDRLLLPTRVGTQIDEFYYRYTLYPARLVQPLRYRLQNVVTIDTNNAKGFPNDRLSEIQTIQTVLRRYDWFTATSATPVASAISATPAAPEKPEASASSGTWGTSAPSGTAASSASSGTSGTSAPSGTAASSASFGTSGTSAPSGIAASSASSGTSASSVAFTASGASGQSDYFQTILAYGDAKGATQGGVTRQGSLHGNMDEILFYWNENWPPKDGQKAGLKENQEPTYRVSYREFLQDPLEHLEKYSLTADPFALLSKGCGISLFLIVPFALALGLFVCCVWGILKVLTLIGVKTGKAAGTITKTATGTITETATGTTMEMATGTTTQTAARGRSMGRIKETGIILGAILILFLALNGWLRAKSQLPADRAKLWELAKGEEPGDRIGALQRLDKTLEPQSCQAHREDIALLARDSDPVVRRYGAKFLGNLARLAGQSPPDHDRNSAFSLLLSLLEDSNINVIYTAAESMGEMHTGEARDILLGILQSNRPWYLKMKVYNALKDVGWINEPNEPKVR